MRTLVALVVLVLSGCTAPGEPALEPDAPAERLATQSVHDAGTFGGTLRFTQTAAVICPLYVESPSSASLDRLPDLDNATQLVLEFNWTPTMPVFESAILWLEGFRRNGGPVEEAVTAEFRGGPGSRWTLAGGDVARFHGLDVYLHIVGPDCGPKSPPAKTGFAYEQLIAYSGNLTTAASATSPEGTAARP